MEIQDVELDRCVMFESSDGIRITDDIVEDPDD